jgi:DNA-binding NarL/FixJ family response regulator
MDDRTNAIQPDGMIRIGVLESSVMQCEALVAALGVKPELRVSLASDLRTRPENHPGLLLDVMLLCVPQCDYSISTAALFEQWHERFPSTAIILLVQRCRKPIITSLLRSGLSGHLVQWSTTIPFLVQAIHTVRDGHVVLCETSKRALFRDAPTAALLTEREREVIAMLAGTPHRTRKQVATLLGISESTVNNHLAHISDKLNAYGLRDILAHWREYGITNEAPQADEADTGLFGPTC